MQKPVLGRKLESLMSRAPGQPPGIPSAPGTPQPSAKGAGVRSLFGGPRATPAPEGSRAPPAKPSLPRWYLLGGDLLLVALALIIAFKSPGPLHWQQKLFCTLLIVLGACLAILAIRAGQSPREGPGN